MPSLGEALLESARAHAPAGDTAGDAHLIETHISWVLLAGGAAWKIKKPVDLGFADFSTLRKRDAFCQEELRLNRRLAPELYLGVVSITGSERSPILEGDGTPIDFAVKMKRFPQGQLLGEVLDRGALLARRVDDLAATVARFHQSIDVAAPDSPFGRPDSVWQPVEENFDYFDEHISDASRRDALTAIRERMTLMWDPLSEECRERRAGGFVRECHGDMHLGNMVLLDDRVTIFDAIDFNPSFRWIDVMNEVAFVVMDLERRRRRDLAYRFLNRYCELTGDYDGVRLMPFYVAYRALIRAKVKAIRFEQHSDDDVPSTSDQRDFDTLLRLASAATESRRPRLLITHGLSGSGKTTFTQSLLERAGVIRIRSDVERKRLKRRGQLGDDLYSTEASRRTYERLERLADRLLDSGVPVIVDAAFLRREQRERFRQIADDRSADFTILDLHAPVDALKSRVRQRRQHGIDASDADESVVDWQRQVHEPLDDDERASALAVDTTAGLEPDRSNDEGLTLIQAACRMSSTGDPP